MKNTSHADFIPQTPAAMTDIWKLGIMAFELWSTSLSTINMRQNLWQTKQPNSASMMKENQRMVSEKLEAAMETGLEVQKAMLGMAFGQQTPWWVTGRKAMMPYYRRSSANSRRLSRRK